MGEEQPYKLNCLELIPDTERAQAVEIFSMDDLATHGARAAADNDIDQVCPASNISMTNRFCTLYD